MPAVVASPMRHRRLQRGYHRISLKNVAKIDQVLLRLGRVVRTPVFISCENMENIPLRIQHALGVGSPTIAVLDTDDRARIGRH